jgi:hypothetical protein
VKDSTLIEEENKKMYTALLQNQVLGIDNPYLLHEMHNSDDNTVKRNLYSQMQKQMNPEEQRQGDPSGRRNSLITGSLG